MKLFQCQNCGQLLYFENTRCERCGLTLGYLPPEEILSALEPRGSGLWEPLAQKGRTYRFCENAAEGVCNWITPAEDERRFCVACRLNRTIPSLADPVQRQRWWILEEFKRRLVYSLLRLDLPLVPKSDDPENGLAFDFLTNTGQGSRESAVKTGHLDGVITIDTAEADAAERELRRTKMAEPYRTLQGHFRHEIAHYYWTCFFQDEAQLAAFRSCFGDERQDYGKALEKHYAQGPPPDWRERFVSAYASCHPWEDWAETWAHYLHIIDTMETALVFGIAPQLPFGNQTAATSRPDFDPYAGKNFDRVIEAWFPLTYAVNSLNRAMGQPDLYPFVLAPAAIGKLRFVHESIGQCRQPCVEA